MPTMRPYRSPVEPPSHPASLDGLLTLAISELGLADRLAQTQAILAWDDLAGPLLAPHARPLRVAHGRLELAVPSATWRNQLSFMKPELLRRLGATVGEGVVRDLIFVNQSPDDNSARSRPVTSSHRRTAPSPPKERP